VTFGPLVEIRLREGKALGTEEAEVSESELHFEQRQEFDLGLHWLCLKFVNYHCKGCISPRFCFDTGRDILGLTFYVDIGRAAYEARSTK
jgi:hypothetical protein